MEVTKIKTKIQEINLKAEKELIEIKRDEPEKLERWKITSLGRKGAINDLFTSLSLFTPEQRKEAGMLINTLKNQLTAAYTDKQETTSDNKEKIKINLSFPR